MSVSRSHTYSSYVTEALVLFGLRVARGRRERRLTAVDLAERAGISITTLRKVERGDPKVAIGTVFEVAALVGVRLFDTDERGLRDLSTRARTEVALLGERVRGRGEVFDDF